MERLMNFKPIATLVAVSTLIVGTTHAHFIEIGHIDLSGEFTLNHNYDFNNPSVQPFGAFTSITVLNARGVFVGHVAPGDSLLMNTPQLLESGLIWAIGGFSIASIDGSLNIAGPDSGRFVNAQMNLSGNGFDPSAFPGGAVGGWSFDAPPYDIGNFPKDITGPITLGIGVGFDNGVVPDSDPTSELLAIGIAAIWLAAACPVIAKPLVAR
jgi:hypothetical protein